MTVIAWDGTTLAADKLGCAGDVKTTITKIRRIRGHLVGGSGTSTHILMHMQWFEEGASPDKIPKQCSDGSSHLLVITPDRKIFKYEGAPVPLQWEDKYAAIGSGREFALAALDLGHSAVEAVGVASRLCASVGRGVDTMTLEDQP